MNSNLLESVFLLNPDAIFVEDEKGVIIDANQRACEIQGIPRERLVGMSIYDLASPERHDEMRVFHQMFWDEEIKTRQSFTWNPSGHSVPVEINCGKIEGPDRPVIILTLRSAKRI